MNLPESLPRAPRAPRSTRPSRSTRFRPAVEELQRRDVPAAIMPGSLSGYVYCDCNDNGVFDAGESPIGNVTITLTGLEYIGSVPVNKVTTTDSNGFYSFDNLPIGNYTITETQPAGYGDGKDTQGTPGSGTTGNDVFLNIDLESDVHGTNNNFGEKCPVTPPPQTGCLTGYVYVDCNHNGKFDLGETGLKGVTVTLTGPGGTRTATTDTFGRYTFTNLAAGTYTITETQPAGYMQGTNTPGTPANGTVNGDVISGVAVNGNKLTGYNFGETTKDCGCDMKPPTCGDHDKDCHTGCDNDHDKDCHTRCDDHDHHSGCDNDKNHRSCDNDRHSGCDNDKDRHATCDGGKGDQKGCDNDRNHHSTCDNGKDGHSGCDNGKDNHTVCGSKDTHSGCDNDHDKGSHGFNCAPAKSLHC